MKDLDTKLTFDTFVIGPANRLASAAARRAADSPGTSYNPLFLYSASGLGKSHILTAVSHHAAKVNPQLRILYQALEGFLDDLERALEEGSRDAMKDRYRDLDILLLDDVQFLAGQPEAQEMLLGTLDALTASGSQIVLASDRPPADINELDARLVSRFSGGLIVDIAPPEYETRVAIIRRKAEEQGSDLQPGVAEALARFPFRNVRELGGALTRIVAIQDLEERAVTPEDVPRIMGEASAEASEDDFGSFKEEVSASLQDTVEAQEEPWRKALRETAEAAERDRFNASRLRTLLEKPKPPKDWQDLVERFRADTARLAEIDAELDRLGNPWPEAAQSLLHDPARLEEAEALLASVRERVRPFQDLAPGPRLADVADAFPSLAFKAVEQLVSAEKPKYNPIYVWSAGGAAARALLAAAGRSFQDVRGERRMAVTSVAEFAEDFIRALSAGVAGAWRERWWTVDLLLVYGAQELSATERAQDEFFHLFEALKRRGARVLLTGDRAPSDIGNIDERLRSRFEGGLVLDLEGAEPPAGADAIRLLEPGAAAPADADDIWAGTGPAPAEPPAVAPSPAASSGEASRSKEGPEIPPLDEIIGEERGGLFVSRDRADADGTAGADAPAGASVGTAEEAPRAREVPAEKGPAPSEARPTVPLPTRGGWFPSGEKVVWNWPILDDRLVEDLD